MSEQTAGLLDSERNYLARVFLLAFVIRAAFMLLVPFAPLGPDALSYEEPALSLVQGKGFATATGEPTALVPPVYPLFLAAIYALAGHKQMAVAIVQACFGAGLCVLLYLVASRLVDGKSARLCGYVAACYPPLIVNTAELMTELLFTVLLVAGLWCLMMRRGNLGYGLAGLLLGLALLTRPFLVFFLPFLAWWVRVAHRPSAWRQTAAIFLPIVLVASIWTLRNYSALHAFVPLANVGGETLYNSYVVPEQGFGFTTWRGLGEDFYSIHDETARSQFLIRKAVEYVWQHPTALVGLEIKKLLLFVYPFDGYWYSLSLGSKYNVWWGMVGSFSVIGLWVSARQPNVFILLIDCLFLSFVLGILVFYGSPRFRLPIEPLLLVFAAAGWLRAKALYPVAALAIVSVNGALFLLFRYLEWSSLFRLLRG